MNKVVVVNDCAHVLEDMIPYLESYYKVELIHRSRVFWGKTLGLLNKIRKAEGDLFHVNYALQDAWLTQKLKRLDVLHCHGSDVRWTMDNWRWGWMVKSNLESAGEVLYSTPDLSECVSRVRGDACWFPTPVRTGVFTPKKEYNRRLEALYFRLKYETLPMDLMRCLGKKGIGLCIHDKTVPYRDMPDFLKRFDIFISCLSLDAFSKTCLEAMSSGLATVDFRHKNDLISRVEMLSDRKKVMSEGEENRRYVVRVHDVEKRADELRRVWNGVIDQR